MVVYTLQVGQLGTNCYLFGDEKAGVGAVVDPGDQPHEIAKMVEKAGLELKYILVTHGHYDHVLGVPGLLELYPDAQVYIHPEEVDHSSSHQNYMKLVKTKNLNYYKEGDQLQLGALTIDVMNTPGHSKGSMVLKVANCLFAGDTLFRGSCGRTDFMGGSYHEMMESLKRLHDLPGDFEVYPGHDAATTLAAERRSNSFMAEALRKR